MRPWRWLPGCGMSLADRPHMDAEIQGMRPRKSGRRTDAIPDKTPGLFPGWRRETKGGIWVAALILGTTGFVVGWKTLSSRQPPVALPVTAALMRPASAHGGVPPPSVGHDDADSDAPELCAAQGVGPPARLRRPAISAADPETQASLDLARDHEARGDSREAEWVYRSLLEKNWSDAEAHAGLGRALSRLGDLVEAEEHLQRAVLLEPWDTRTRLDLAAVQLWLLSYSSARQQLQAVVDADPGSAHADGARTLLQLVDALDAPG